MDNQIWILNPDYGFKNDNDRICMFAKKDLSFDSTPDWIGYIHPNQAMILSVFTELRPVEDTIHALSKHLNVSTSKMFDLIKDFMGNRTPIFTTWQGIKVGFPKNVLINPKNIENPPIYDFSFEDLKCSSINLTPDRSHRGPHSALWMLTNKCVTNCKYCYADRKTSYEPLSTQRILEIIDEFSSLKMGYVDIIGGEIFLRKDWDVILKKLVDNRMSPTYISTKLPITESLITKLSKTGFKKTVQISLDSLNDSTLNNTIGTATGYVDKIKTGINLLEKFNYPIQIDTILTSENTTINEIMSLYQYVRNIKNLTLWEIRVPEASLYTPNTFSTIKATRSKIRAIQNFVNSSILPSAKIKIIFSAEALNEKFRVESPKKDCFNGGSCGILQNRMFILPDGKVSICEQMYWHKDFIIGDLKTSSVEEVWNSQRALQLFNLSKSLFRDSSPCKKCTHFDDCNAKKRRCVVKVIKAYGLENWDFPDPRCKFAPIFNNDLIY
jgi:radical SAM protein with 4Fe4S-binding SPASM domain